MFFSNLHYRYFQGSVSKLCILFKFIRPIMSVLTILTDPLEPPYTHIPPPSPILLPSPPTTYTQGISNGVIQEATHPTSYMLISCKPYPYTLIQTEHLCSNPFICSNLMLSGMLLEGGAFRSLLGLEGGALVNSISALTKKMLRELPHLFCLVRTQLEDCCLESGSNLPTDRICQHLELALPRPQNCEK